MNAYNFIIIYVSVLVIIYVLVIR